MSKKIGLGIIGRNFGYNVIYKSFIKNNLYKVVGFSCKRKDFKKINLPKKTKLYFDWKKLILNKNIKAIVVASPPFLHKKIITFALRNNKHIFCEKPFTCSEKESSYILKKIKNRKALSNFINYEFVEIDAFRYFKKKIIDKVKINKIDLKWFLKIKSRKNSWKENHNKGGGLMYNYCCHTIYYLEFFFGKIVSVKSSIFFNEENEIKSLNSLIKFKSGLSAKIIIEILSEKSQKRSIHELAISSKKNVYILSSKAKKLSDKFDVIKINKSEENKTKYLFTSKRNNKDFRIDPTLKNSKKFSSWILKGRKQKPNFSDGNRIHFLINKIMLSAKKNREIDINLK